MRCTLLLLAAVVSCSPTTPTFDAARLRVTGSDTMTATLLPRLASAYGATTGTQFQIVGGGSADGLRALLKGEADLAASVRLPTPAENDQAKALGWAFERHLVGLNVVTLAVHPQNPTQSLSWDQVRDIFCTGRLADWSELGLEARPIRVLVRDERSGAREAVEDFFCGAQGISARHQALAAADIDREIQIDPTVITFATLADRRGKVLALRARPDAPPIAPTQANAIRGKYPLTQDIALYTAGPPSAETRRFLDWIASPAGQHEVDEAWVVPLYLRAALLDGPRPLRETISFPEGSVEPDERSAARLGVLVDELRSRAGEINHVVLEGYADPGEREPLTLSYERVAKVREHLAADLPALFFEIIPRGDGQHLAPTDTPLGRAMNRSVRIYFGEEESDGGGIAVSARPEPEPE
jgi:phosphate transport system substrate-binding protein